MPDIITQSTADAINAAWHKLEAEGWRDMGRFNGGLVVQSIQGDIQRWTYADILTAADALKPREIPDNSQSHLASIFIRDAVNPEKWADSQAIWRKPTGESQHTGPTNIRDLLTPAGVAWFDALLTDDSGIARNKAGKIPMTRRLLRRDGMRALSVNDDLLVLSLSDDGVIDMVRAGRSLEAIQEDYGCDAATADELAGSSLEAAYDRDQEDYGTTGTACFHLATGSRAWECEMG